MKTLCVLLLYTTAVTDLCWMGQGKTPMIKCSNQERNELTKSLCCFTASTSSCQVYPSEYAYHKDSVTRTESASANCRMYPSGSHGTVIFSEHYIHCNGTQLRLSDSEVGPQSQYVSSYYYEWSRIETRQLLFIFPTRVSLTTITLHYYSDSQRGLPPLRFYAVPDDFNVWDGVSGNSRSVTVNSVLPGVGLAGLTHVDIEFNVTTKKILMVKAASYFRFAASEVEFFSITTMLCML